MRILCLFVLALLLTGCSARIVLPPPPDEPRAVFLLDHGRHSSLVLARADGSLLRYSYGDWDYYAHGKVGLWHTLSAVVIPTRAALGRRELAGPAEPEALRGQVKVAIERLIPMRFEATRVELLLAELDRIYQANLHDLHYRSDFDLEFVPHPHRYTLWHNSNRVVADWLIALGAEVHGSAVLSAWQVE